jgi:hypothetical protein
MRNRLRPRLLLAAALAAAVPLLAATPVAADDLGTLGSIPTAPPSIVEIPAPPGSSESSDVDWKEYFQDHYPVPKVEILPKGDIPPGPRVGNQGAGCRITGLPPGELAGTQGCGPCVGVIVVSPPGPGGVRTIWVFHFSAGTDAGKILSQQKFPPGSHMVLFGGDCDEASRGTMESIKHWLEPRTYYVPPSYPYGGTGRTYVSPPPVIFDGYYNAPSMLVDCNGKYFVPYSAQRTCNPDGSVPQPDPTKW